MNGYITAKRVALVRDQLSPADHQLINYLGIPKLLSGEQLRRLVDATTESERRALRRQLAKLTELRVVSRIGRRVGGVRAGSDGYVYALDVVGQRLLDPKPRRNWRQAWTPGERMLDHILSVSELYVRLVEAERADQLELMHFSSEPKCWRSFVGPGGARLTLKPDAHAIVADDHHVHHLWIEVDRNTESLAWITEKAKTYHHYFNSGREQERHGVFPRTIWIAPDETRANGLAAALTRLPEAHWQLHQVTTEDHAISAITNQDELTEGARP